MGKPKKTIIMEAAIIITLYALTIVCVVIWFIKYEKK